MMYLIENRKELHANIKRIDEYLTNKVDPEYGYALDLIKRGTCFIALTDKDNTIKFYPSRFIGYRNNTMNAHLSNDSKDGKETNPKISSLVGMNPIEDSLLEQEYIKYCDKLGFVARDKGSFGVQRKYWSVSYDFFD